MIWRFGQSLQGLHFLALSDTINLLLSSVKKIMSTPNILNNPSLWQHQSFINNQWVDGKASKFDVINPFDGQVLTSIQGLDLAQVHTAIDAAHTAWQAWAKTSAKHRATLLHRWADLIDEHTDDLAKIMTLEQGKPLSESTGEMGYANSFIRWFAEEGRRVYGDIIAANQPNLRHQVLKQPIGVCAAITPWNFPAAMITRKVAPALAAGCTIIVKPDSQTPLTALALAYLAQQAGLPAGVFQVVLGDAQMIGEVLCQHPTIRKLSFTGSTRVGKILMANSANTLKKLSLELGGNAPFIVFDDANLEQAVDGLIASKYRNAGQTCVCANRIFVQNNIKEQFVQLLASKVATLRVGNGLDKGVQIGPMIHQDALQKAQKLLNTTINQGAKIITGGTVHHSSALALMPTIIDGVRHDMEIAQTEIFAPILPIFGFDDENEVINLANDTPYGLAAYFYTNNMARSWRVCEALEYGMVAQNTGLLSTEVAPFGGVKESGFGREGSKYGIDEYLTIKYWCLHIDD